MKKLYFYILDKIRAFGTTLEKRELNNNGIKIDTKKKEYRIYHNSSLKMTKSLLIILVFSLMGILAKNSNEPINVFGFDIIVWKFAIILSLIFASNSIYQSLTHNLPKIIMTDLGIKIKHQGFFPWKKISKLMIETEYTTDSYGKNYNLVLEYENVWYRTYIDELNMKKEEIEGVAEYLWKKNKKTKYTLVQ